MLVLLDRMGHADVTVHGFRRSFRNWSGEQINYPREICELALAHVNSDEPSERFRAIGARRAKGKPLRAVGDEFGLTPARVNEICRRVEEYDRSEALLRSDPASIEPLALIGRVEPLVHITLAARGIKRLTDLEDVTMAQLLRYPNIGRQSATFLFDALTGLKRNTQQNRDG